MRYLIIPLIATLSMQACLIKSIGGNFHEDPSPMLNHISDSAKKLIDEAFEGLDFSQVIDTHTHVVGLGKGNTGLFVNPLMQSFWHFSHNLKYKVYLSGSGIRNEENADAEYVDRLVKLIKSMKKTGKYQILAFDKHYDRNGNPNLEKTEFYVPNEYVFHLAEKYPDYFEPVISVHPYRKDALMEMRKWAARGARMIKWLPNAMGMDPGDKKIESFYKEMKLLKIALLTHAGEEKAVEAEEDQKLGNPLRLRLPLDLGVRVIVAHCASLGSNEDLDAPEKPMVKNFDLFTRLMNEKKYEGLLFGEISAMQQANRLPDPLLAVLNNKHWHHRLYNGSDYPLPAINVVVRTGKLEDLGFITEEERDSLNEIYKYNPLLFDFVLKRTVKHPVSKNKFAATVFYRKDLYPTSDP